MKNWEQNVNNPVFIKFVNIQKTNDKIENVQTEVTEFLHPFKRVLYTVPADMKDLENSI